MKRCCLLGVLSLLVIAKVGLGGVTGKIAGKVSDAGTGEPLPAANVMLEGTNLGGATDVQGEYIILNVPPGTYTLVASMMGYRQSRVANVIVRIDLTTNINVRLHETVIEFEEPVTVVAERPLVRKDITSSLASVGAEEIAELPVQDFAEVLQMQAGVTKGSGGALHIRGGRSNENAYLVDGMSLTDPFSGGLAVSVENVAIQELQVVSGTFNAEYGQAMSGVVNIVTKEALSRLAGRASLYVGDYLSPRDDIFFNIDDVQPLALVDATGNLSGPVPGLKNKLSFFASARYYDDDGFLYGQRRYSPSDSSNFDSPDPEEWYVEMTGDSAMVPMDPYKKMSAQGKLTYAVMPGLKVSYELFADDIEYKTYTHSYKYNPDGDLRHYRSGYSHLMNLTHTLSPTTFYTLKFSHFSHDYKSYVYEDPKDPRYVDPRYLKTKAYSFHTGGTDMGHYYRNTRTTAGKLELTSQVTKTHQIKTGVEIRRTRLWLHEFELMLDWQTDWKPEIPPRNSYNNNEYTNRPLEASFFVQDKMEFRDVIANVGIRYDYFDSNGKMPIDEKDPTPVENNRKEATPKHQISPRLGIAYPITDRGVIHFSYGHFLQIPPFQYLYHNSEYEIVKGSLSTVIGNPDLEPQRTVMYEVGLQQQLSDNIGFDVTVYYRNIKNLLGTEVHDTYIASDKYAKYINRDYGNVRGIVVSLEKRRSGYLSATIDYTYQVAEGNASDPGAAYYDVQSGRESEKQLVYLDWDQTHTLNFSVTLSKPGSFGVSVIGRIGSGLPYTPQYRGTRTSFENSERKPPQYIVDLRAHKDFELLGLRYSLYLSVYNLFDRLNEKYVYSDTGRAGYSLIPRYTGAVRWVNTLDEYLNRPDYYQAPRQVRLGIAVEF